MMKEDDYWSAVDFEACKIDLDSRAAVTGRLPSSNQVEIEMIIDHIGLSVLDFDKSKELLSKALAPLSVIQVAALQAGGKDNGAPGVREIYHPDYYGAFVIDPNGHIVEAVCHCAATSLKPPDGMPLEGQG